MGEAVTPLTSKQLREMESAARDCRNVLNIFQSVLGCYTEHVQAAKEAAGAVSHVSELIGALQVKAERMEGGQHGN